MRNKVSEKVQIIRRISVQYPDLGLLGKRVVWAQAVGGRHLKFYVWVEDCDHDDMDLPSEAVDQIPLDQIFRYSPNVCKSKSTAETIFEYYVDGLKAVTQDTLDLYHSKHPIPVA